MLKYVILICCLITFKDFVFSADCSDHACLTRLYNAKVTFAQYYIRPVGLNITSGSLIGRKKKRHDYHLYHAGVVLTVDIYIDDNNGWLIHKGSDYGDKYDTVITNAMYMGPFWYHSKSKYITPCGYTVNDFLAAASITSPYKLLGPNCQTAANGMWELVDKCNV